jgi:hypothetical protein
MPAPINPRLVARVERSLRKRLNSNIGPHLARCAAHARSEDEFMAAAARLLLNPQERQQWLASWTTRRMVEGSDTVPAELDGVPTTPAALDAPGGFLRYRLSPAQRDRLRDALANELGPIADILLDNESQRADSVTELLQRLETHLETDEQRTRFRQATLSSRSGPEH